MTSKLLTSSRSSLHFLKHCVNLFSCYVCDPFLHLNLDGKNFPYGNTSYFHYFRAVSKDRRLRLSLQYCTFDHRKTIYLTAVSRVRSQAMLCVICCGWRGMRKDFHGVPRFTLVFVILFLFCIYSLYSSVTIYIYIYIYIYICTLESNNRGISFIKYVHGRRTGFVTFCVETAFYNGLLKERYKGGEK